MPIDDFICFLPHLSPMIGLIVNISSILDTANANPIDESGCIATSTEVGLKICRFDVIYKWRGDR